MATKKLAVFINLEGIFVPAGVLEMTEGADANQTSRFEYGLRYIDRQNAVAIDPFSLSIADKNRVRGITLFPNDGQPFFGSIRDAAPDGWGRRVIESRLKAPLNSLPESTYLLEAGSERIGALDIRKSIDAEAKIQKRNSVHRIEYLMEAADRIEQGLPIPTHLEDIFDAGTSMGGMRPKSAVEDDDSVQWIAKFPAPHDRLNVPFLECATMRLAALAGLNVPIVKTQTIGNKTSMLIKRFDRSLVNGVQHRHHMVSALTMLGCHESESRNKSYWDIADVIRAMSSTASVKHNQKELFGRMVFNILVTNDDDHLRNHAFLWSADHKAWELSPLYDVMPRPMTGYDRNLHLGVGIQGRSANLDNALSGHARFGLTLHDAKEVIDRIWSITREWKNYFEEWSVPHAEIEKISTAFRHIDDVFSNSLKKEVATSLKMLRKGDDYEP